MYYWEVLRFVGKLNQICKYLHSIQQKSDLTLYEINFNLSLASHSSLGINSPLRILYKAGKVGSILNSFFQIVIQFIGSFSIFQIRSLSVIKYLVFKWFFFVSDFAGFSFAVRISGPAILYGVVRLCQVIKRAISQSRLAKKLRKKAIKTPENKCSDDNKLIFRFLQFDALSCFSICFLCMSFSFCSCRLLGRF